MKLSQELLDRLHRAAWALSHEFRLALVAVDVVGLSQREAARALDVREPTIGTRVFRARERLALALTAGAADG